MKDVTSDAVESIGYDAETRELFVKWKSNGKTSGGKTSVYGPGVSPLKAEKSMTAWSVNKAIRADIAPNHPHRYLP